MMELWKASEAAEKEENEAARKEREKQLNFEREQRQLDRESRKEELKMLLTALGKNPGS